MPPPANPIPFIGPYVNKIKSYICFRGPDECWPWISNLSNRYGEIRINGRAFLAHRLIYYIWYGIDAGESLVCHK
jgi:hypothetical protein